MLTRARRAVEPALPWVVLAWTAGVLVLSVRQLGGWLAAGRLKHLSTRPEEPDLVDAVVRLARVLGVRRCVTVLQSLRVSVPAVVGWLRPVILLPAGLATGLTPDQLQALLAHELAHIRRHDYLVNLLQSLVETLLFYHPAVWFISRRIRLEREHCCDDLAVAAGAERISYAESLLYLAHRSSTGETGGRILPVPAVGATGRPSDLRGRVGRLLGARTSHSPRLMRSWPIALVSMGIVALATSLLVDVEAEQIGHPPKAIGGTRATEKWGPAVHGVRARLGPDKSLWNASETPALVLKVQNQGKQAWDFPTIQREVKLEIDGTSYSYSGRPSTLSPSVTLKNGQVSGGIAITLDKLWLPTNKRRRSNLRPGKHTIRAICTGRPVGHVGGKLPRSIKLFSNPVEIQILSGRSTRRKRKRGRPPATNRPAPSALVKLLTGGRFETLSQGTKIWADSPRVWKRISPSPSGARFLRNPRAEQGTTAFEITRSGRLLLACTRRWGGDGKISVTSRAELLARGWRSVNGELVSHLPKHPGGDPGLRWEVFERFCEKGETFKYRTENYCAPVLILMKGAGSAKQTTVRSPARKHAQPKSGALGKPKPICKLLMAKRAPAGLVGGAVRFLMPWGDGRRGANGFVIDAPKPWREHGTQWEFRHRRAGTARGIQIVHPFGDGHVLVTVYRGVHVSTAGHWRKVGYGGKGPCEPVKTTPAFSGSLPLRDNRDNWFLSHLGAKGDYRLTLNGQLVATAQIAQAKPLSLLIRPDARSKKYLTTLLSPGQAALIVGPMDRGINVAQDIRLAAMPQLHSPQKAWPPRTVYSNDFEGAVGREWSKTTIDRTPKGRRGFLGQFTNETVTLSLKDLPAHQTATVAFDLFIIRSWDGSDPANGQDTWSLSSPGVGTLLHTTFSNNPNARQFYPGNYGGKALPAKHGAAEKGTLGYRFERMNDSVYRLRYAFRHTAGNLQLHFSACGLEGPRELESWGLDNVRVTLNAAPGSGPLGEADVNVITGGRFLALKAGARPWGDSPRQWKHVAPSLRGGKFLQTPSEYQGVVQFAVRRDGRLRKACTKRWGGDGKDPVTSRAALLARGWRPVNGQLVSYLPSHPGGDPGVHWEVFERFCKKGEVLRYRTEKYLSPALIVASDGPPGKRTAAQSPIPPRRQKTPVILGKPTRVCRVLAAKRLPGKLRAGAIRFTAPYGDGRGGANGFLLSGAGGPTQWAFRYARSSDGYGFQLIHPWKSGHVLVTVHADYLGVSTEGSWAKVGWCSGPSLPITRTAAFKQIMPIVPNREYRVVSLLDAAGNYHLSIDGKKIATAKIRGAKPLDLTIPKGVRPPHCSGWAELKFEGKGLPNPLEVNQAGIIIAGRDSGYNLARDIMFSRPQLQKVAVRAGTAPDKPLVVSITDRTLPCGVGRVKKQGTWNEPYRYVFHRFPEYLKGCQHLYMCQIGGGATGRWLKTGQIEASKACWLYAAVYNPSQQQHRVWKQEGWELLPDVLQDLGDPRRRPRQIREYSLMRKHIPAGPVNFDTKTHKTNMVIWVFKEDESDDLFHKPVSTNGQAYLWARGYGDKVK